MNKRVVSVGIAGGAGSGKTTLSEFLRERLDGYKVKVIHMDKYYKKVRPFAIAPFSGKRYEDFNHPDAVDIDRVWADWQQAIQGGEADVIVVEGFLLFQFAQLRDSLDLKVYVDCRADERLLRRIAKFTAWGYAHEDIVAEYMELVRFRHDEFVEPTRWHADLIVNGSSASNGRGKFVLLDWIESGITKQNET